MRNKRTFQVKCYLSEDELERINNNARVCGKIASAYVREAASNFCIFEYDNNVIFNHTEEIGRLYDDIKRLVYLMRMSKNYFWIHGELLFKKMKNIREYEGEFIGEMLNDVGKKSKVIEREVKRSVRRRLAKEEKRN